MGTTTLNTMLPEFARHIGAWVGSYTTTTNVAGSSDDIISTALRRRFPDDDDLNDAFIRILGSNNDDLRGRIEDYVGSTGTISIEGENLSAESGSVTFEIYRYDPDQLVNALNDGRQHAFPALHRRIFDRTLTGVLDQHRFTRPTSIQAGSVRQIASEPRLSAKSWGNNIIGTLNCDFESSTISTDWTASSLTLAAEAETTSPDNFVVFAGTQSAKWTVATGATGTLLATVPDGTNYEGEEINVGIWAYSLTTATSTSYVKAAIQFDSDSAVVGTAHSGKGWERLKVSSSDQSIATSIKVGLQVVNATGADMVGYADEVIASAGSSEIPQMTGNPIFIWREEADEIVVPIGIAGDQNMLVAGHGLLSSVSSGSDTVEIDGQQLIYLYNIAAQLFFQQDIDQIQDDAQITSLRTFRHFNNRMSDEHIGMMSLLPLRRDVIA